MFAIVALGLGVAWISAAPAGAEVRVSVSYQLQSGPCYDAFTNPTGPTYSVRFRISLAGDKGEQADLQGWCGAGGPTYTNGIEQTSVAWPDAPYGLQPGQTASLVDENFPAARRFYVTVWSTESPNDDVPDGTFGYKVTLTDPDGSQRTLGGSLAPSVCVGLGSTPAGGTAPFQDAPYCQYFPTPEPEGSSTMTGLKKALKKCKRKRNKQARQRCIKRARKRFGT